MAKESQLQSGQPGAPPSAVSVATQSPTSEEKQAGKKNNRIEEIKREKNGLEILGELPRFAREGWESIGEADRERLKWAGIFFRKQTPGHFMMRLRSPNGFSNAKQFRAIAAVAGDFGKGFVDITTRQQIQLRWFKIDDVPEIWNRLEEVGLVSLQTGMDNVRNVIGCAAAGLTPNELFDASAIARQFTDMLLGNREYSDLPRKFNVAITGCLDNCVHSETQDIALTPATVELNAQEVKGFNVAAGGKVGSGGYKIATPLDIFVAPEEAAAICEEITFIFRDHGSRESRSKSRLAFLIAEWGPLAFRDEVERRMGRTLMPAGKEARGARRAHHGGVFRQKQRRLNFAGLSVPAGRISGAQLLEVARLAETYGSGDIRLTCDQDILIPNIPDEKIAAFVEEPLLQELRYDPSELMRGLVSCTGTDYCHLAMIETKELAIKTARYLERHVNRTRPIAMHWSGCPAGCGNHSVADIGLLGKNIRVDGQVIDAVDIFVGGKAGPNARTPIRLMENVPCDQLDKVLVQIVPYIRTE